MHQKLSFTLKEQMIQLSGACFWFWNSFYRFLGSSGVPADLQKRYPRDSHNKYQVMSNILNDLEDLGRDDIIQSLIANLYRLPGAVDRDNLDPEKAKRLLSEFRATVGNDPIEAELQRRRSEEAKQKYEIAAKANQSKAGQLAQLFRRFQDLTILKDISAQKRGFELEKLFMDLALLEEFEVHKSYRTSQGEQIDGHFRYEKFDYLVEAKWTKEATAQSELSVFDGKIRGKAQSTRGLFLSASGFDANAIVKYSGDSPRIILMTGEDLMLVLEGRITLFDAMKYKVDAIVRKGQIMSPLRSAL